MVIPFLATVETTRRKGSTTTGMIFFAMFLGIFGLRSWLTGGTSAGFSFVDTPVQYSDSRLIRSLTYMFQHAYYAWLMLMPWNLAWDYSYDAIPLLKSQLEDCRCLFVATAYLALVCLLSGFANGRRKSHEGLVGVFFVVVPFLPASNLFFVVGVTVGERLLYTSTCGIAFILPAIIDRWILAEDDVPGTSVGARGKQKKASEAKTAALVDSSRSVELAAILAAPDAGDDPLETPAKRPAARGRSPSSASASAAGTTPRNRGKSPKAAAGASPAFTPEAKLAGWNHAQKISLPCAVLLFLSLTIWLLVFLVNINIRVGHWENREILFGVDTHYWPKSLKSHHQLGTVYHRMNRWEEALYHYNTSLTLHDDNALTDYCIAQVYIETSQFDLALPRFEKILKGTHWSKFCQLDSTGGVEQRWCGLLDPLGVRSLFSVAGESASSVTELSAAPQLFGTAFCLPTRRRSLFPTCGRRESIKLC